VYERGRPAGAYLDLQRAMFATVDEIAAVIAREGIDADFHKGGRLTVALDRAQEQILRERLLAAAALGLSEHDLRALDARQLAGRVRVAGARAAVFTPHGARVQPAKLLTGLAAAVARLGVEIHEHTPVGEIRPHLAQTPAGPVRARWVLRATEGYTAGLRGLRRALVPMNSSMIITEPLGEAVWEQLGWEGQELLSDAAHVHVYLQRSRDGRVAIGGRGRPYRYGSRTDGRGSTAPATVAGLRERLAAMFPALAAAPVAHAWSGVLGVPRDWCMSVAADPASGLGWAGGYVGEGVAAANLAGRTLAELVLEAPGELGQLAWVGRAPRRWEPEPLRWAGIQGIYAAYRQADRREHRRGSRSRLGALTDAISGRV
jgi:glycine/D-amino acid oxidase-like deaminating enzyme